MHHGDLQPWAGAGSAGGVTKSTVRNPVVERLEAELEYEREHVQRLMAWQKEREKATACVRCERMTEKLAESDKVVAQLRGDIKKRDELCASLLTSKGGGKRKGSKQEAALSPRQSRAVSPR